MSSDLLRFGAGVKNDQICTLCETYATQAISYLSQKRLSRNSLTSFRHHALAYDLWKMRESSNIQPEELCDKVNLCELVTISSRSQSLEGDSCDLCHQAVAEVILKLQDPDTQLDILEMLLNGCSSLEKKYVKQCKMIVFEYGPLILTNGAKFLDNSDICTTLHACESKLCSI